MITSTISTPSIGTVNLPLIEAPLVRKIVENMSDVQVLSGNVYTDFVSVINAWEFRYETMTKEEYDSIYEIYQSQFTDFVYPLLSIPFYDRADVPVRMSINDQDVWDNCGSVENVVITFRESDQI